MFSSIWVFAIGPMDWKETKMRKETYHQKIYHRKTFLTRFVVLSELLKVCPPITKKKGRPDFCFTDCLPQFLCLGELPQVTVQTNGVAPIFGFLSELLRVCQFSDFWMTFWWWWFVLCLIETERRRKWNETIREWLWQINSSFHAVCETYLMFQLKRAHILFWEVTNNFSMKRYPILWAHIDFCHPCTTPKWSEPR